MLINLSFTSTLLPHYCNFCSNKLSQDYNFACIPSIFCLVFSDQRLCLRKMPLKLCAVNKTFSKFSSFYFQLKYNKNHPLQFYFVVVFFLQKSRFFYFSFLKFLLLNFLLVIETCLKRKYLKMNHHSVPIMQKLDVPIASSAAKPFLKFIFGKLLLQ